VRRSFTPMLLLALTLPAYAISGSAAHAAEPGAPDATPAHHARQTWEQHFAVANATHDGHLTPAEAKDGFPLVAKHFEDIDADHKGYVTQNDMRAWRIMKKAAHRLAHPPEDKLKPRNAMHLVPLQRITVGTGA
jgi:hypothetical protein